MSSMPENVNFGNPNVQPSNFFLEAEEERQKTNQFTSQQKANVKQQYSVTKENIFSFLNSKATTILAFATAIAIGLALKDFMGALVLNIFQPILMNIILLIDKNDYLPITPIIREKNPQIDIAKFLGSILIVKLVIILMYFLNKYEHLFLF